MFLKAKAEQWLARPADQFSTISLTEGRTTESCFTLLFCPEIFHRVYAVHRQGIPHRQLVLDGSGSPALHKRTHLPEINLTSPYIHMGLEMELV